MKKSNGKAGKQPALVICPVCGETELKELGNVCPVCGWEHDYLQSYDYEMEEVANNLSVMQTREWFKLKRILDPNYTWKANAKEDGNPSKDDLESLRKKVKEKG
jgi:ribosomal protein L32